ncbi:MAG: type II secretion system GspH family protein [Deferribacteraceae bacterium]|jgi:prepilin-type N-terminal cleavage/methylation domain-containing protein|nr:type II secretion system GspH family protein [Deferribacteraceae bacterium]
MRKGFSMVELAIVLVVIGIIMGMALKGGEIIESARIRKEARKLERFEIAVAVAVQKLGPKGTVGQLETYDNTSNYLSEDFFQDNGLLVAADYETYTMPLSTGPEQRKRIYNSRLDNNGGVTDFTVRGDPGATLVFSSAPFLICQLENILDDRDKVTGQGAINFLNFTDIDGQAYELADLENTTTAKLNYFCTQRWTHTYIAGTSWGEYFWRLL